MDRELAATIIMTGLALFAPDIGLAQDDPRSPDMVQLPMIGRMSGTITRLKYPGSSEEFGRDVRSVGDIDGSGLSSWIVQHKLADTGFDGYNPKELLLYRGVRGALPSVEAGQRIGPSELASQCKFLTSGDWDGDSHVDLAISQVLIGDTTQGLHGYPLRRLVIYWGQDGGEFTNADTTHLLLVSELFGALSIGVSAHIDGDAIDDLLILGRGSWRNGLFEYTPALHIYRGHDHQRWGRAGLPRTDDWHWWSPPPIGRIEAMDHDGDGNIDIAMMLDQYSDTGQVSVLYGRRDGLPDTTELETVTLGRANGHTVCLSDLTGDRIPELSMACGFPEEVVRVFVGLRGQRLREQYGTGADPPNPGSPDQWWGRPWAEIWLPRKINPSWPSAGDELLWNLGDVGLDGVGDLAAFPYNSIVWYNGGRLLDSLIDAWAPVPATPLTSNDGFFYDNVWNLGDIDGSGEPAIAIPYWSTTGTILFVKATRRVPRTGVERQLPPGTDTVASGAVASREGDTAGTRLDVWPNPARDEVHLRWPAGRGMAAVSIHDIPGRELRRMLVGAGVPELVIPLRGWPAGAYVIEVQVGGRRLSRSIAIE